MTPRRPETSIRQRLDERWGDIIARMPGLETVLPSGGQPSSDAACLEEWKSVVLEYAERIAGYDPDLAPKGKVAKQLSKFAVRAHLLKVAIGELEPSLREHLRADALRDELMRARAEARRLVPRRIKKSGGSRRARTDRAIKRLAAEMSFEMLFEWVDEMPTTTVGGSWVLLTEILVWVATGRDLGDVSHACRDYMDNYVADVFPKEERREIRREGSRRDRR